MNICENCHHEFEVQQGIIQICPMCGQEFDEEATIEDLLAESSSVNDETLEDDDGSDEDELLVVDEETEAFTEHLEDQEITALDESEPEVPTAEFGDDELTQTAPDIEDTGQAKSETVTEFIDQDDDETDFEINDDIMTDQKTEAFAPVDKQPTIELDSSSVTVSSLDYAEREITGFSVDQTDNDHADYIIAVNDETSQLGSGASGIVYRATQKSLDRTVAIKLLKKQVNDPKQSQTGKTNPKQKDIEKFLYESQITAGLDHPNVITVHDLGITSNNTLFYSMKLFEGGKDWTKVFDKNTLVENLDIFNDVCDAMRRAHRDRIIHRDLKPQNVLVGDFGEVQVTDWGLAIDLKNVNDEDFSGGGTPCYMAPEMSSHYLAQQELRLLRSKLDWAQTNTPNNSDEIEFFKSQIKTQENDVKNFGQIINELSDIYVLGAILFQIAKGFPPHLYQVSEVHRRKWGKQTSKNKIRRELEMSANGTVASYHVRKKKNSEASLALRDIALKAMAFEPKSRYQTVDELQLAVKDFRVFLRCVEDTHRGNREIELANEAPNSYVNLNNAMYAYEGALENYPEYEPANQGLAKARFLFAERALNNQDFELGLSTLTDENIASQPDIRLATELRDELAKQRDWRDRRKRLLFFATMASLVAIATGIVFGIIAIYANHEALAANEKALAAQHRAGEAIEKAGEAKQRQIESLEKLAQAKRDSVDKNVQLKLADLKLGKIEQAAEVASLSKKESEIQAELEKSKSTQKQTIAELKEKLAEIELQVANFDRVSAQYQAEKIKEDTQYNQYINRLKSVEDVIGEPLAKSKILEIFGSADISLPVKNSWELHHLYKRANPHINLLSNRFLGEYRLLESSANGNRIVALIDANRLVYFSANDSTLNPVTIDCLVGCNVLSMDVSDDGRWLMVARDFANEEFATDSSSLPVIYDLKLQKQYFVSPSVTEQLRFESPKLKDSNESCKEKYYCRPQFIQILDSSEDSIRFFMVDQRTRLGINQLRCSVLDLHLDNKEFSGSVAKAKVGGQMFLKTPGLLTGMGCLASAVETENGEVVAAVANSHPYFGVSVLSISAADSYLTSDQFLANPLAAEDYFDRLSNKNKNFNSISTDFAPTAMKLIRNSDNQFALLIGNGKGEIAEISYAKDSLENFVLTARHENIISESSSNFISDFKLVENRPSIKVTKQRQVFSSTNQQRPTVENRTPIHKSAVRKIEQVGDQVFSASESEILVMKKSNQRFEVTKSHYGHPGRIAAMTAALNNKNLNLYAALNVKKSQNRIAHWQPDSVIHDATIQLQEFRSQDRTPKRIVAGAADKNIGSRAISLGFDDGTYEIFSPEIGRIEIGRPRSNGKLDDADALSIDDLRMGKLALLEKQNRLVLFSNKVGILSWPLNTSFQSEPQAANDPEKIFAGPSEDSANYFSASENGNLIVTSHPTNTSALVIWRMGNQQNYTAEVFKPFSDSESTSSVEFVIEPKISPDGKTLAIVRRFRNAYQVYVLSNPQSQSSEQLYVYRSPSRTSFGSIHFVANNRIMISEDRTVGIDRRTRIVSLNNVDGMWTESSAELPKAVRNEYQQIDLAAVTLQNGDAVFAGFAVKRKKNKPNNSYVKVESNCLTDFGNRDLIVWGQDGILFHENLPFSRRINPNFDQRNNLVYFVEGISTIRSSIKRIDLFSGASPIATSFEVDDTNEKRAKRWSASRSDHAVIIGYDWFYVLKLDSKKVDKRLTFDLNHIAERIELANNKLLVQHTDKSVSYMTVDRKQKKVSNVQRMKGHPKFVRLSPDGKLIAYSRRSSKKTFLSKSSDDLSAVDLDDKSIEIDKESIAATWVTKSAAQNLGLQVREESKYILASLEKKEGRLELSFWEPDGKQIEMDKSSKLSTLPLENQNQSGIRSFSFAPAKGDMISVVWENKNSHSFNLWKYATNGKPKDGKDEKSWFRVDVKPLGNVSSVHFSEVSVGDITVDKIASRIVICGQQQGTKYMRLYALELGGEFKTKPLLELTTTDKLQNVDEIVGAQFSGDGKTLVSMTSERARIRFSDGWNEEKTNVEFEQNIKQFRSALKQKDWDDEIAAIRSRISIEVRKNTTEEMEVDLQKTQSELAQAKSELQNKQDELTRNESELEQKFKALENREIEAVELEIKQLMEDAEN